MKFIYFSAPWCGPCRVLAPVMEEVAKEVTVEKYNIDENITVAGAYGVRGIPMVILVNEDGSEIKRVSGPNSKDFYINLYNQHKTK